MRWSSSLIGTRWIEGGTDVGPAGATAFTDALQANSALRILFLAGTLSLSLVCVLAGVLASFSFRFLAGNNIGPSGATALVSALRRNSVLHALTLFGAFLGGRFRLRSFYITSVAQNAM